MRGFRRPSTLGTSFRRHRTSTGRRFPALALAIIGILGGSTVGWQFAKPQAEERQASADASSFVCADPVVETGAAIRCRGMSGALRLHAIEVAVAPPACAADTTCPERDAARAHLRSLAAGGAVQCQLVGRDRRIVRCVADEVDLSCAMVRDGYAIDRHGELQCGRSWNRLGI
jgi:endonuclease YncB( thermonuclease family)